MTKNAALVSIIVPVYGTEKYLPACINSIRNQLYKNIQIILVDDQSPDGCPEICDAYAKQDNRIMVIHQKNKGVSGARNTGLLHAVGEYIMFIDSDDEVLPDAVNILLKDALDYGADIVWAPKKSIDKKGSTKIADNGDVYTVFREDSSLLHYLNGGYNMDAVWSKLFKRTFIEDICFEEGKNINEDGFFMFLCYMKKPLLICHNVSIYQYNVRPDSCSRQKFSDKYLSMLYFCDKKRELVATYYPQYINEARNMEFLTYLQLLDILCSSTDKKYKELEKRCIKQVCKLHVGHKSFNKHYAQLAWIVVHGLYPLYKIAIRFKYYR